MLSCTVFVVSCVSLVNCSVGLVFFQWIVPSLFFAALSQRRNSASNLYCSDCSARLCLVDKRASKRLLYLKTCDSLLGLVILFVHVRSCFIWALR